METRNLLRIAVTTALGAGFLSVLDGGALRLDASGALALLALVMAAAALGTRTPRLRTRLHLVAGALASALFALDLRAWLGVVWVSLVALGVVALTPRWGKPDDLAPPPDAPPAPPPPRSGPEPSVPALSPVPPAPRRPRDVLVWAAATLALPIVFLAAAAAFGNAGTLARDVARALPIHPFASAALLALETLVVLLAADGAREDRPAAPQLAAVCLAGAAVALALRVAWIAALATLPTEVYWPEAPFLVNALKLDAHVPLYGPPEALDSYTYSPLLDLLHHAVLRPFGLELSLHANRLFVLAEQAAAIALLGFALAPFLRHDGKTVLPRGGRPLFAAILALAALGNPLAPAVHPDHPLLFGFALAVALVAAERRWPRALWWIALATLAPIAVAFKLSGAGVGLGLFAIFAYERRWKATLVLALSGVASIATVPLFDATVGRFSYYALGVQASHPIVWSRALELPLTPAGATALLAIGFGAWFVRLERRAAPDLPHAPILRRVAFLTGGVALASLPAYVKYAGRENNVALLVVGASIVTLLAGARAAALAGRRPHPLLAPSAVLLAAILFRPPPSPEAWGERAAAIADDARLVRAILEDDKAGRHTLLLVNTSAWIRAGHHDVPHDRLHSAIELFYGGRPEADLFFEHVADGRYETVIATSNQLRGGTDPLGRFNAKLRESLRGYTVVWPDDGRAPEAADGIVVFRRSRVHHGR